MSGQLTGDLAAMRDAFIAANGVTICPPRTHAIDYCDPYSRKRRSEIARRISARNIRFQMLREREAVEEAPRRVKADQHLLRLDVVLRDTKIASLYPEMSMREIARAMGLNHKTVKAALVRSGVVILKARPPRRSPSLAVEARRREVAVLLDRELTQPEIAREIGVSESTIQNDVRALVRAGHAGSQRVKPSVQAKVVERRIAVARLRSEGLTARQIAQRLGATDGQIAGDFRVIGRAA